VIVQPRALSLPSVLKRLQDDLDSSHGVLSVFLDTSPRRVIDQGHVLVLRDGCKAIRPSIPREQQEAFELAVEKAESHLTGDVSATRAGLAIFAGTDPDSFYVVPLPVAPREAVVWDKRPHIAPLQAIIDDHERIAVALFDKEHARLFTIFLDEVETQVHVDDYVPGKQATGGWYALAQTRFARHHEDHVHRHAEHTAATLMVLLRARPFDRLLLAGPEEALAVLRRDLPRPLKARLVGNLSLEMFATDSTVVEAATAVAATIEREAEVSAIRELINSIGTRLTVLGRSEVLEAINQERLHKLFVADGYESSGAECVHCHRLLDKKMPCPVCGSPTEPVADLHERMVELVLQQGGLVETVSGEAAFKLTEHGGLGAWTRY